MTRSSNVPTALTLTAVPATAQPSRPPHIVLFIADDFSWHDSTPYGATDVRTPHLQRLADSGLTFTQAFVPSPTCTPSRSAIYTGLYPLRNGAHANHSLINENIITLPVYLHQLGYRAVIAGKTHIGPREQFPFEYLPDSNIMPEGKHELLYTDLNTNAVEDLIANHDPEKPLCLIVASHSPHVYWTDNDGYDPSKINLPPYLVDTPETRNARCQYYADVSHLDAQLGDVMRSIDSRPAYKDNTLFFFTTDHGTQWPNAKWSLYDAGIRTPLIARWPRHIQPHTTTDAMTTLVDLLPTMLEAAGAPPPTDLDGKSLLPLLQGQTTRHREEIYATHTGDNEMNRAPMRCIRTPQYKYILNLAPEILYTTHISQAGPRDGKDYWDSWTKIAPTNQEAASLINRYRHHPKEELYDVKADPYELKNLIDDPTKTEILNDLRAKLKHWREQQGDNLEKPLMPEDGRTGNIRYAG